MKTFEVHPQIQADSTFVVDLELCQVRLHHNAAFPWLMLIPNTAAIDLVDMPVQDQHLLLKESALASKVLRELYHPDKLNYATIGNAVSQIHWHVIARFKSDAAWPRVTWYSGVEKTYEPDEKLKVLELLRAKFEALGQL